MHGTPGEDGKLQGYFDTLNTYTGCDYGHFCHHIQQTVWNCRCSSSKGIAVAKSVVLIQNNFTSP